MSSLISRGCYLKATAHISALKMDCSFIFFKKYYYFFFFSGVILMTWMDNADQDKILKPEGLCPNLWFESSPGSRALGLCAARDSIIG